LNLVGHEFLYYKYLVSPMAMMDKTKLLSLSSGLVLLAIVVGSHGTKLLVTTVLSEPFMMESEQAGLKGFCVDLMEEMSKLMTDQQYEFQKSSDGRYGYWENVTGWNGMIGDLLAGRADIALADLTMTSVRGQAVDFSVPFMNTGASILYSKVGQQAYGIHSVDDLLRNPDIKIGWVKGGSTHYFLASSTLPTIRRIWQAGNTNEDWMSNNKAGMEKVLRDNGKFAFIMEKKSSEYYAQNNCQFIHIGGLLNEKSYAIAMPKNSPYQTKINDALMTLQNGKLLALKNKWWREDACREQSIEIPQGLVQQLRTLLMNIMKSPRPWANYR